MLNIMRMPANFNNAKKYNRESPRQTYRHTQRQNGDESALPGRSEQYKVLSTDEGEKDKRESAGHCRKVYLNVTIICEYKILRFWGSNDFAGINFCDFTKSS